MILPIITVQPDLQEVIQAVDDGLVPNDSFWVSCYKTGEPSVHANVLAELDDVDRNLVRFSAKDGDVQFIKSTTGYAIACEPLNIPLTPVLLPIQEYKNSDHVRPQRITAFDVSPDGSRYTIGHLDGSISICASTPSISSSSSTPSIKRKLISKPHHSSVTSLKFFPSSRVILSSGSDFSLSIISAEFPTTSISTSSTSSIARVQPVRILRGHTRPITSSSILGIGRNVISASLDGNIKLWDVPSGEVISNLKVSSPVQCICLGPRISLLSPYDNSDASVEEEKVEGGGDSRETKEINETFLYAGLQNGKMEIFDLKSKKSIYLSSSSSTSSSTSKSKSKSQINAMMYIDEEGLLVTGDDEGIVCVYDVKKFLESGTRIGTGIGDSDKELGLVTSFKRNEAAITGLDFISPLPPSSSSSSLASSGKKLGLAIATKDGLPYIASISFEREGTVEVEVEVGVYREFVGVDCDPVSAICVRTCSGSGSGLEGNGNGNTVGDKRKEVWLASDDEIIRRYQVNL